MTNSLLRILALILSQLLSCSVHSAPSLSERVLIASAEERHDAVISELVQHDWSRSQDVDLLISYCWSRFQKHHRDQTCLPNSPHIPQELNQFGDALLNIWSGRTKSARNALQRLAKDDKWLHWGTIGQLEVAHYTENDRQLREILSKVDLSNIAGNVQLKRSYNRYRLLEATKRSDWAALDMLLKTFSIKEIVANPDLFWAKSRVLYVSGSKGELSKLIQAAEQMLKATTVFMLARSDLALLEGGLQKHNQTAKVLAKSNPGKVELIVEVLFFDVLDSSPNVSASALSDIQRLAKAHSQELRLVLDLAARLASYHKRAEAGQLFKLVDAARVDLDEFAVYHLIAAWDAVYRNNAGEASKNVMTTLGMSPSHTGANWLKAVIAKSQSDQKAGTEAVVELIRADPYNENFVSLILDFQKLGKNPELATLLRDAKRRSGMYSKTLRERFQ